MLLAPGTQLCSYGILAPIGVGGMGEVRRARDTRLAREVAIQVLPEELADDEERLRRFEREAKARGQGAAESLGSSASRRLAMRNRLATSSSYWRSSGT